jgi:L-ascorbate metabolism protein UlaG (beta-lactamase superfamily)
MYQEAYWREVVQATGARRVVLVHWDDFWKPLDEPLVPMPRLMDNFDVSMQFLLERARLTGVEVQIPSAWISMDPFAGTYPKPFLR